MLTVIIFRCATVRQETMDYSGKDSAKIDTLGDKNLSA